jgi:hypothetical protein
MMKALWQRLTDRRMEHQTLQSRTTTQRPRPPQGSTPIVGIAADACWRWLLEGRRDPCQDRDMRRDGTPAQASRGLGAAGGG